MIYFHTYEAMQFSKENAKQLLIKNLAHYLNIDAPEVLINHNINGKPLTQGYHFSISHCQDMLIQAFTENGAIGIDLEYKNANRKYMQLAKRYFHKQEYHYLTSLNEAQALQCFYQLWTTKEAVCKAKGGRLWYYLSYNYLSNSTHNKEMRFVKTAQKLNIRQLQNINNYSLSVACEGSVKHVCYCDE